MAIDLDVAYVARLARLKLSAAETELFQAQLAQILEYAERLNAVDVSGIDDPAPAGELADVWRDDAARDWFTAEEALRNAPRQANDLFILTKVVA